MSSLKHLESESLVHSLISPEEMDVKVSELSSYSTTVALVSYSGAVNPDILAGWALLLEGIQLAYGGENVRAEGLNISRVKSRKELEDTVVQNLRSDRYYNPGNYADITSDMITD
jgi:hypothetical protein